MDAIKLAKDVLKNEADALTQAADRLNLGSLARLLEIFDYLRDVGGSLVFCGVGKSGLIAQKIASTFSSLGLPSYFLHPTEALHGDLGRMGKDDAIVLVSKSGATEEIVKLIPYLPVEKNMRIGLLGNINSAIAAQCGVVLDCSIKIEAGINNQAPTTSSIVALGIGDVMAVLFEHQTGLSKEGFAVNHPGGILGKSLRLKVRDLMTPLFHCPKVSEKAKLKDVILEMTKFPVGGCAVLAKNDLLLGIVVEGDIRRTFIKDSQGLETPVTEIMNKNPLAVSSETMALQAMKMMEGKKRQVYILPVLDEEKRLVGILRMHDLLKEGFGSKE